METKETQGEMHLRHKLELGKEIDHLRSELQKAKELNGELVKFIKDNLWANEHDWNRINELIKKSEI